MKHLDGVGESVKLGKLGKKCSTRRGELLLSSDERI
jgi:hypothetical protein